jgi:hypothetical protein
MLFSLLLALLVVATLALFTIGAILAHQQRAELGQRRSMNISNTSDGFSGDVSDTATVRLGELVTGMSQAERNENALAKLKLAAQAQRQMADIIG